MGPLQHHHVFQSENEVNRHKARTHLCRRWILRVLSLGRLPHIPLCMCRCTSPACCGIEIRVRRQSSCNTHQCLRRGNSARLRTHVPCCTTTAQPRNTTVAARHYRTTRCRVEHRPWQTGRKLMSGLNPMKHSHWKLPTLLVHVPLCAQTSSRHSSTSAGGRRKHRRRTHGSVRHDSKSGKWLSVVLCLILKELHLANRKTSL